MTPGERVVVEAAIRLEKVVGNLPEARFGEARVEICELREAVWALLAERQTPEDQRVEEDITWGQVVEGDLILSERTGKWYPVTSAVRHVGAPVVLVQMTGIPKKVQKPITDPVKVKRGATGKAVDVFASVLWSMPTAHEEPEASGDA
jgi:hypothetical protein